MQRKQSTRSVKRRQQYQDKRSGAEYEVNRKRRVKRWQKGDRYFAPRRNNMLAPINLEAPVNLEFINNTDEVIEYIEFAKGVLKNQETIRLDISNIKTITSDAITVLISHIKDPNFNRNVPIFGNAPSDRQLRKFFTESGFYNYVRSPGKFSASSESLLHKESNFKVKPDIAEKATLLALENSPYNDEEIEAVYNTFIELMSNTHHHASLEKYGSSKWWLYVFNNKPNHTTEVCFLDLGVGIFKSIVVRQYLKKMGMKLKLVKNLSLVDDLLFGKIQSRIEEDNEIRGKGIPQIMDYAKEPCFKSFYLITNDVKLDIKSGTRTQLKKQFKGTFYYFELSSNYNNGNQGEYKHSEGF